jgi:hypothetical protein
MSGSNASEEGTNRSISFSLIRDRLTTTRLPYDEFSQGGMCMQTSPCYGEGAQKENFGI